jgi:hypothetical protein
MLVVYTNKSGTKVVTAVALSDLNKFIKVYPDAKPVEQ